MTISKIVVVKGSSIYHRVDDSGNRTKCFLPASLGKVEFYESPPDGLWPCIACYPERPAWEDEENATGLG